MRNINDGCPLKIDCGPLANRLLTKDRSASHVIDSCRIWQHLFSDHG